MLTAACGQRFPHHGGPLHARAVRVVTASTPVGFEPTRGDPIGLAGRRLNRSAKVSLVLILTPHQSGDSRALRKEQ